MPTLVAFASFGFIAYYIGAKLHAFDSRGRGHTWRLCIAVIPLFIALLVAVSRTCDYHHHWQDVTIGGLIGLFAGYISYTQYYPSIFCPDAGIPLVRWPSREGSQYQRLSGKDDNGSRGPHHLDGGDAVRRPLLADKEGVQMVLKALRNIIVSVAFPFKVFKHIRQFLI